MSQWRRQALAEMPDLRRLIDSAPNVMALWIELQANLAVAYEATPPDEEAIRRIYRYALWTVARPRDADATTAVVVAFLLGSAFRVFRRSSTQHASVRADIHRWISPETFTRSSRHSNPHGDTLLRRQGVAG